jgi:septal ring factor EnvC (AmiA/AmiB activator)
MERIKQKMDEARKQRENIQQGYYSSADAVAGRHSYILEKGGTTNPRGTKTRLFLLVAAVIIALAIFIWWHITSNEQRIERFSDLENQESRQTIEAVSATVEKMNNKIALLATQMDALSTSISQLDAKLINTQITMDAFVAANTRPAISGNKKQDTIIEAGKELDILASNASGSSGTETSVAKSSRSSSAQVAAESYAAPVRPDDQHVIEHEQPAAEARKKGPWVVNLASTPSKVEADRLAQKALSKNIQTELQPTTVNGTKYWRVQVTGFPTADDARAHAEIAKKHLGIKDAWIMKR